MFGSGMSAYEQYVFKIFNVYSDHRAAKCAHRTPIYAHRANKFSWVRKKALTSLS